MQGNFTKDWEMQGMDGYIFARFGSAIADIGDIDGNNYNDVAVGAPLEEDNGQSSGSIYIYNGYEGGIRNRFSQVSYRFCHEEVTLIQITQDISNEFKH